MNNFFDTITNNTANSNNTVFKNIKNFDMQNFSIDWDKNKLKKFMGIIILGYFSTKILYAMALNFSSIPFNDEIPNFVTILVLSYVIFIFTNIEKRWLLGRNNNTNWIFFIGYIFGLNIPFIGNILENTNISENKFLKLFLTFIFVIILITMIWSTIKGSKTPINYIIYVFAIIFLIFGLILTRKQSTISYVTSISDKTNDVENKGFVKNAGTKINFSYALSGFLLSLLFVSQPEELFFMNFISVINGIVLGLFVGGLAYYGFPYILNYDSPSIIVDECPKYKNIIVGEEYTNINSKLTNIKWIMLIGILILIITIITIYLSNIGN